MIYYSDGYCEHSNPSLTGGGYTIFNKKKLIKTVNIKKSGFTNNEAELLGVFNALKIAKKNDTVITDSRIIVGWVWNGNAGSRSDLSGIAKEAKQLLESKEIALAWLSREMNLAGHYNEQFEKDASWKMFK